MDKPPRSNVGVTFTPKPNLPITLPCPVYVHGEIVGELIGYDGATGKGTAALSNDMTAADILFLSVLDYGYSGLSLSPDENNLHTPPDLDKIDAIIETFPGKDEIDGDAEEALVDYVLAKMGNPRKGGRRTAIIRHVQQWYTIHNSP
jgi:hypothetical protein